MSARACQECGATKRIHQHHDDYALPNDTRSLCAKCHRAWHDKHGSGKNSHLRVCNINISGDVYDALREKRNGMWFQAFVDKVLRGAMRRRKGVNLASWEEHQKERRELYEKYGGPGSGRPASPIDWSRARRMKANKPWKCAICGEPVEVGKLYANERQRACAHVECAEREMRTEIPGGDQ